VSPSRRPSFALLTRIGQAKRLRCLAWQALAQYDLAPVHLGLLEHWNNTTFRVIARTKKHSSAAPQHYVLRINRPNFQDRAALEAEAVWLARLRQDLALRVPCPVRNTRQDLVTLAAAPGVPQARHCVLFSWLEGRFFDAGLRPIHLERVGVFLARLHGHAQAYSAPGLARKSWTCAAFFGAEAGIDAAAIRAFLSTADKRFMAALRRDIEQVETVLGRGATQFGLIHGDFYQRNFFFYQDQVGAIDFDECGWGYYLYDVAVALAELRHRRDYPLLRRALLKGYRQVRPLPKAHEAYLPTLICARLLGLAVWVAGVADHPGNRHAAPQWIAQTLSQMRRIRAGDWAL
jgi:Ser/Thr protein kinase RdoA (MazF antagonist)